MDVADGSQITRGKVGSILNKFPGVEEKKDDDGDGDGDKKKEEPSGLLSNAKLLAGLGVPPSDDSKSGLLAGLGVPPSDDSKSGLLGGLRSLSTESKSDKS